MQRSEVAMRTTFARNVDHVASHRGLSRSAIARGSGCARSHVVRVLAGDCSVGLDCVAKLAWMLEVECAPLFEDVGPPPICVQHEAPENLRHTLATNVRAYASAALGTLCVEKIAMVSGWHPSRVYDVLGSRVSLCIDKLETLAISLRTTPAALLRRGDRRPH